MNNNLDTKKVYIFLYNVIQIKSDFVKLKQAIGEGKFILIASEYCINALSPENRSCFDAVYNEIPRDFHQIDYDVVEKIVNRYVKEYGSENIRLMTNEDSTHLVCAELRENEPYQ